MKYELKIFIILISFFCSGCSGCSRSGRKLSGDQSNDVATPLTSSSNEKRKTHILTGEKTVVKMRNQNGVFEIPTEINGVEMYFIFDTGASVISISSTEANFLFKQGKITNDDIKGTANFTDANGDISEGTILNLRSVKIGDRVLYDVEASVVNNANAPLLFGQSALSQFGKISIDNNRGEITFE